ncbi:diguanylate cyclase [Methylophilaceae bacterium]|jgi:catechol-2,3-dioxygenase|nr:diguanylate cyclase [Methylophilaceae bacterium]
MIVGINHYNLRADEKTIEALKEFYIEIVGLTLGHRPPFKNGGYWLYANQKDVLHLSFSKNGIVNQLNVNSTLDHIAFTCQNENMHIDLLNKKNIKFSIREVPEIGTRQIFFKDPAGNGIELIFPNI